MKNITRQRRSLRCITIAATLGLGSLAFGQQIFEQRFNEAVDIEFKGGGDLGPNGSGVSGKPEDKAYSADAASSPNAMAVVSSASTEDDLNELTITAWYRPQVELPGATTLFNAFGTLLNWDDTKKEWVWRVGAKPVDAKTSSYWFFSGRGKLGAWTNPGDWAFIALVWQREGSRATFYQGGNTSDTVLAREMTRKEEVEPLSFGSPTRYTIGNDATKTDRMFNGEIDNVRVFRKALDLEAVEKIRQADANNAPVQIP